MALYGSGTSPKIEALINGTWTDISSRVRGDAKCVITRGRANEQARTAAQNARLTLENADAYFTNRNPNSANFGLIPRNTQLRIGAGSGDNFLRLPFNDKQDLVNASTADKAVLDITSDIDVRAEIWPHSWRPGRFMILMSKWQSSGNNLSWVFYLRPDGHLSFSWTTGGSLATRTTVTSQGDPIGIYAGHIAVRATLDVNNGAGGKDIAFYTSTAIGGSWTALGGTTTTAGTTSIFSGAADLVIGGGDDIHRVFSDGMGFGGKFYKAEVYSGIAGTRVANFDATAQSVGASSWSDGLGTPNTWTLTGYPARITTDRLRFWGELASLPKKWDKSGTDVTIPAVAAGQIRRLTQGATPVRSPMYRNFTQYSPYAYWTFEDESDAASAGPATSNASRGLVTAVDFAAATTLPGAARTLAFTGSTGQILGKVLVTPTNTGTVSLVIYVRMSAIPASNKTFLSLTTGGTARRIDIGISTASWRIDFYDAFGTNLGGSSTAVTLIDPRNGWVGYNLLLQTNGTGMDYSQRWDVAGGFAGGTGPTTIASCTVRPISAFKLYASADSSFNDAQFAHMFMSTQNLSLATDAFREASIAYLGETAGDRMDRLSDEEGVPIEITGMLDDTETMGYQTLSSFMDLIYECWDADGGVGGETRDALALSYRTRVDLERGSDVTLDYSTSDLSEVPEPTDDDQGLINDATVRRVNASSARSIVEDGPNSVLSPPDGVGRYDTDITLNVGEDDRLPSIAGWITLVGSWDQDRYPNIQVAMHRGAVLNDATLLTQMIALDLGDTMTLSGLPSWMPPDDVPEIAQGYTETLSKFMWEATYNGTPAGPYRSVPLLDDEDYVPRLDANGHATTVAISSSATSIPVTTPVDSALWVTSAAFPSDFPMDIKIGGEVITISAAGAASGWLADDFNRSTSSGWGSTSTGSFPWSSSGGSATDYSTAAGTGGATVGRHNMSTTAVNRTSTLDIDAYVDELTFSRILLPSAVTGVGGQVISTIKIGTASTYIGLRIFWSTGSNPTCSLQQVVNNVETVFDSGFGATGLTATQAHSVRIQITPTQARARMWLEGGTEGGIWRTTINLTDPHVAGDVSIISGRNASTTNAAPYYLEYDNVATPTIQILTASARSVNGIVKAQAAQSDVRLAQPFYLGR